MKKLAISVVALCLAGCSHTAAVSTASASATTSTKQEPSIWTHEPDLDFDKAGDLPAFNYGIETASTTAFGDVTLYVETEKSGYPGEWNSAGYTKDAMLVEKNNEQGIYSHAGEELYSVSLNKINTAYIAGVVPGPFKDSSGKVSIAYGTANTAASKAQIFSSDFKSMNEVSLDQFTYNVTISDKDPFLAYQGDTLGIAGVKKNSSGAMTGWAFEAYTPKAIKENMVIPVIDAQFVVQGYAIFSPDGTKVNDLSTEMKYRTGSYINGYYVISDGTYTTLIDAASGGNVATQYQDAKYFEDGYAPVKKNGKWGYVDHTGKEVTDFIFDDACTVYDGYAWVYYNGKYGILNFQNTLDSSSQQINAYWCSPTDETALGKLTVNISDLSIRKGGSTDAKQTGTCMNGSVYPVFEQKKDTDYTWYRINEEDWVASEGTWATYEETK